MKKQQAVGKPLFGKKEEPKQPTITEDKPVKKRGRPKKEEQKKPIDESPKKKTVKKQERPVEDERPWKDYYKQRPSNNVPCEFYVQMGRKRSPIGRGFIENGYIIYTDEPYYIIGARKKYGNLFYREIGCPNLDNCPDGFPKCKLCKGGRK